jgi:phosphoribosylformimino-5-aminoimidazole carboxamide ribonucleotide (ProFAR) isomerase
MTVTHYNSDPRDQVRRFVAAGCSWIHVVDLDAAARVRPEDVWDELKRCKGKSGIAEKADRKQKGDHHEL